MMNPTELNGKHDVPSTRIAELEAENALLKEQSEKLRVERDLNREALIAHMIDDLPPAEEEFLRLARDGQSFGELLVELGFKPAEAAG